LEERVAELEATAAKHGNRKVSVVIYGQVDYAFLGLSNANGWTHQNGVVMNSAAPTFLGISGDAKINAGMKAGFRVELGMDDRLNMTTAGLSIPLEVVMRRAEVWIEGAPGKLTAGHGSMASDGAGSVTTANTEVASRMLSLAPLSTVFLTGYDLPYNDVRRDMLRYDSPSLMGFMLSASLGNGDVFAGGPGFAVKDAWDVALRYANEVKGVGAGLRIAGAIAYRDEQQALAISPFAGGFRSTVTAGSVSVMEMGTGLFVNAAYGRITNDIIWGNATSWHGQFGIEKAFFKDLGATTLFGEYGQISADAHGCNCTPSIWGLGAVQNFAGLATDVYVDYKHYDITPFGPRTQAFDQYMGGIRIKF
jgi:predicted porin